MTEGPAQVAPHGILCGCRVAADQGSADCVVIANQFIKVLSLAQRHVAHAIQMDLVLKQRRPKGRYAGSACDQAVEPFVGAVEPSVSRRAAKFA